jgi:hypothetical protein
MGQAARARRCRLSRRARLNPLAGVATVLQAASSPKQTASANHSAPRSMPDSVLPGRSKRAIENEKERTEGESEGHWVGVDDVQQAERQPRPDPRVREVEEYDQTRRTWPEVEQIRVHLREQRQRVRQLCAAAPFDGVDAGDMDAESYTPLDVAPPAQRWNGEFLVRCGPKLGRHSVLPAEVREMASSLRDHVVILGRPRRVGVSHQKGHARIPQLVPPRRHRSIRPFVGKLAVSGVDVVPHHEASGMLQSVCHPLNDDRIGHFVEVADQDQVLWTYVIESSPNGSMLVSLPDPWPGVLGHVVDEDMPDLVPVPFKTCEVVRVVWTFRYSCVCSRGFDEDELIHYRVEQAEPELEQRQLIIEEEAVPDNRSVRDCHRVA